jgi:hypothetical protein
VTHVAQCVVFGAVMSDAAMLDAVLELDVGGKERVEGGRHVEDGLSPRARRAKMV